MVALVHTLCFSLPKVLTIVEFLICEKSYGVATSPAPVKIHGVVPFIDAFAEDLSMRLLSANENYS